MTPLPDAVLARLKKAVALPALGGERYELRGELGRGGMGTVYAAWDRDLQREIALKVLEPGFEVEPSLIAGLEHPGIIPVHDRGVCEDGRVYYTMPKVEGHRLDAEASRTGAMSDRLRIFQKICDAVGYAHSRGVIHRDLKPQNVMTGRFGQVFVLDWGVPAVQGTPRYMAPEQARGEVTERSDIYALGRLLEELAGPGMPRALVAIAARACEAAPQRRYGSAQEMSDDVSRYLDGERVQAHAESLTERAARFGRRNQTLLLIVAAYVAVKFFLFFLRGV